MIIVSRHRKTSKRPNGVYIGRGSPVGNPFRMKGGSDEERARVIAKFREWFYERVIPRERAKAITVVNKNVSGTLSDSVAIFRYLNHIRALEKEHGTVYLECFCAPKACHGDVIKEYLDGNR